MQQNAADLPKVTVVSSSVPIDHSQALHILSQFLQSENVKLQEDAQIENHWDDLVEIAESLAATEDETAKVNEIRISGKSSRAEQGEDDDGVHSAQEVTREAKLSPVPTQASAGMEGKARKKAEKEAKKAAKKEKKLAKKLKKEVKKAKKEKKRKREN
jgi:uncharacterized membrane protein